MFFVLQYKCHPLIGIFFRNGKWFTKGTNLQNLLNYSGKMHFTFQLLYVYCWNIQHNISLYELGYTTENWHGAYCWSLSKIICKIKLCKFYTGLYWFWTWQLHFYKLNWKVFLNSKISNFASSATLTKTRFYQFVI